ncbi:enoyl-CoA hydratase [Aeromicrobium halocynthiae]|uniref:Enoyl-CoA hydratase n=1 Tax=Aeromicrobium halocynthiae TaxID=560557 RepID=A0ABN2VVE9_9ACTN
MSEAVHEDVLAHVEDGVGTITLNRPERRNALSQAMISGVTRAMTEMEASREVGVIVITGAGGAFCSGGDVQVFDQQGGEGGGADQVDPALVEQQRLHQRETVGRIHRCVKPVVAALPGAAAGAGLGLALAADLRIGSERTVMATAFGAVGLSGDFGVAWLLERLVGPAKARELLFLGTKARAQECLALGLINQLVAEDELLPATHDLARRLAAGPSQALAGMKQNLLRAPFESLEASMDAEVPLHKATGTTQEHLDAVRAFVRKEAPTFATGWHDAGARA